MAKRPARWWALGLIASVLLLPLSLLRVETRLALAAVGARLGFEDWAVDRIRSEGPAGYALIADHELDERLSLRGREWFLELRVPENLERFALFLNTSEAESRALILEDLAIMAGEEVDDPPLTSRELPVLRAELRRVAESDPVGDLRRVALEVLADVEEPDPAFALKILARDRNTEVRSQALGSLESFLSETHEALAEGALDEAAQRTQLRSALEARAPSALETLSAAFNDACDELLQNQIGSSELYSRLADLLFGEFALLFGLDESRAARRARAALYRVGAASPDSWRRRQVLDRAAGEGWPARGFLLSRIEEGADSQEILAASAAYEDLLEGRRYQDQSEVDAAELAESSSAYAEALRKRRSGELEEETRDAFGRALRRVVAYDLAILAGCLQSEDAARRLAAARGMLRLIEALQGDEVFAEPADHNRSFLAVHLLNFCRAAGADAARVPAARALLALAPDQARPLAIALLRDLELGDDEDKRGALACFGVIPIGAAGAAESEISAALSELAAGEGRLATLAREALEARKPRR